MQNNPEAAVVAGYDACAQGRISNSIRDGRNALHSFHQRGTGHAFKSGLQVLRPLAVWATVEPKRKRNLRPEDDARKGKTIKRLGGEDRVSFDVGPGKRMRSDVRGCSRV